jgi:hypothetical protein
MAFRTSRRGEQRDELRSWSVPVAPPLGDRHSDPADADRDGDRDIGNAERSDAALRAEEERPAERGERRGDLQVNARKREVGAIAHCAPMQSAPTDEGGDTEVGSSSDAVIGGTETFARPEIGAVWHGSSLCTGTLYPRR